MSNYKRLGDYIVAVKDKNTDLKATKLLGINIDKFFMPSVANVVGTDLSKYKVVKKNQFACNRMHVGRDYRIPIALSKEEEPFMVSPAYDVFEIIDTNELNPEYLMMWFSRKEFDRNAWFYTDADVRGGLAWEAFCNMKLPVPSIERQNKIVAEYNTVVNRIKLNEQLNQKLEETAQALYKHWFVDFEFPNEQGKPYKSSGGKMMYNEELGKDIPEGWEVKELGEISLISAGGDKPKKFSYEKTDSLDIPIYSNSMINEGLFGYTSEAKVLQESITISARGGIGFTAIRLTPYVPIVRLIVIIPNNSDALFYLFHYISNFNYDDIASAQGQLTVPDISSYKVIIPNSNILRDFQSIRRELVKFKENKKLENNKLNELKDILLSKMAKG